MVFYFFPYLFDHLLPFISDIQNGFIKFATTLLPTNSPVEWTGWISSQSKGLSSIFSNTTV